ncbi:MAG: TspO/MBR family protein [Patescibacteria group bacterium]|jgi:tryptophan-rich sensory protein
MKNYQSSLVIILTVIATAVVGSFITSQGMVWYETLILPPWTPDGSVIGTVWTVLFVLTIVSLLLAMQKKIEAPTSRWIWFFFFLQATLNVLWSLLFFGIHAFTLAIIEALLLGLSVLFLSLSLWKTSKLASALLFPYVLWVCFATFLTYAVTILN